MKRSKIHIRRLRVDSVECVSMREELAAIEQFGAELGEQQAADYMFNSEKEIDMNAFCDRYLDKQLLGCSTDAASYFDSLSARFGFACRAENSPPVAASPAPASTLDSGNLSTT